MGGSGQPLETFGRGFKGKPGNLEMARPNSMQLWWLQGDKHRRKPWTLSQSGVGWWDEALPQGFGGLKALGAGLGGGVLPRSRGGGVTGERVQPPWGHLWVTPRACCCSQGFRGFLGFEFSFQYSLFIPISHQCFPLIQFHFSSSNSISISIFNFHFNV